MRLGLGIRAKMRSIIGLPKSCRDVFDQRVHLVFQNRIGLVPNIGHLVHDTLARVKYSANNQSPQEAINGFPREASGELKKVGFTKLALPLATVLPISKRVNDLITSGQEQIDRSEASAGLLRLKNSWLLIPEVDHVVRHSILLQTLQAYFNADVKLFGVDVFRTLPAHPPHTYSSQLWHLDNAPRGLVKVMIYLTDVTSSTGAIRLVPKSTSRRIFKNGFWNRYRAQQFENEIEEFAQSIEGPAGTCVFFTPQYCIHKAIAPQYAYRDVLVLHMYPALKQTNTIDEGVRLRCSTQLNYLVDPFRDIEVKIKVY